MSERPPRIAADGVYRIIAGALLGKKNAFRPRLEDTGPRN
ncbi:hypothetical protein ACVIM9_008579 [Bradyrhizobium sp. USDA 4520]